MNWIEWRKPSNQRIKIYRKIKNQTVRIYCCSVFGCCACFSIRSRVVSFIHITLICRRSKTFECCLCTVNCLWWILTNVINMFIKWIKVLQLNVISNGYGVALRCARIAQPKMEYNDISPENMPIIIKRCESFRENLKANVVLAIMYS